MRFNQHIKTTTALALTFGAITAPAALAGSDRLGSVVRPNPDEQTTATRAANSSPVLRPNPDQENAVNTGASSGPGSEVSDNGGYGFANVPPTIVRVSAPSGGFDWGDAGIGAAGGFALSMLGLGGALAVSQRRRERQVRGSARTAS